MGLLFLDIDEYDMDEVTESDNPLVSTDVDRLQYPDLWDTIDAVSADDLALTGVAESEIENLEEKKAVFLALYEHMEELLERREEDRIIDADLDRDTVTEVENDYVSTFTDVFVLRTVFRELGWIDIRPYDDDEDVDGFGYNVFYPKRGFIPAPPAQFIHHLDQRVRQHVDSLLEKWIDEDQEHLADHTLEPYDGLSEKIAVVCQEFDESGKAPQAIITGGFRSNRVLTESEAFSEDFQPSDAVIGQFAYDEAMIPIYQTSRSGFDVIVLTGTDQPVTLTEYHRDDTPVFVNVEKVTRQLLEEMDAEQFDDLSDEELRDRLQQVRFRALYYGQFDAADTFGATITVTE